MSGMLLEQEDLVKLPESDYGCYPSRRNIFTINGKYIPYKIAAIVLLYKILSSKFYIAIILVVFFKVDRMRKFF